MATQLNLRRLPNNQVELSWQAEAGKTYHVQRSTDLMTWVDFAGPYDGEDAMFVLPIFTPYYHANFRLVVSAPIGYSVPVVAITAFSGEYVQLQWENLGPPVNNPSGLHYTVVRDGRVIWSASGTELSYRDSTVVSGATHRYEIKFY